MFGVVIVFIGVQCWGVYFVFVIVFVIVCGLFLLWQWVCCVEMIVEGVFVMQNFELMLVEVGILLFLFLFWRSGEEWCFVELWGCYFMDEQLLVCNWFYNVNFGFEVFVLFWFDDGIVFVVD